MPSVHSKPLRLRPERVPQAINAADSVGGIIETSALAAPRYGGRALDFGLGPLEVKTLATNSGGAVNDEAIEKGAAPRDLGDRDELVSLVRLVD